MQRNKSTKCLFVCLFAFVCLLLAQWYVEMACFRLFVELLCFFEVLHVFICFQLLYVMFEYFCETLVVTATTSSFPTLISHCAHVGIVFFFSLFFLLYMMKMKRNDHENNIYMPMCMCNRLHMLLFWCLMAYIMRSYDVFVYCVSVLC